MLNPILKEEKGISFKASTDEELQLMVWRGRMVEDLRANQFYKDHLVPAVQEQIEGNRAGIAWHPRKGITDTGRIALDVVWRSGLIEGTKTITDVMNTMLYEAEQAQKEIDRREKEG